MKKFIGKTQKSKPQSRKRKPQLFFVDHIFHTKTRSFDFLIDILSEGFDVEVVYVDPETPVDFTRLKTKTEHVLIAQMDFLTPFFIAEGKRVTVVQMYDGSSGLPESHYELNRQAQYLNFSVSLHARALSLGVKSHLVRYFTNPTDVKVVQDFSTLRGFFWQRLPQSGINNYTIQRMLSNQLDSLHIHTPTDDGSVYDPQSIEDFKCQVTTSDWFEKQSGFTDVMESCNVFIAPRYAEGIGHAFLEAMARGMLVIAYDLPTHNEYISNWVNGILFSSDSNSIDLRTEQEGPARMAATARLTMELGYERWVKSQAGIVDFVKGAKQARAPSDLNLQPALEKIMASYQQGIGPYIQSLDAYRELGQVLGSWDKLTSELEQITEDKSDAADLTEETFFFGWDAAHTILGKGWSATEPAHVWAIEHSATLNIPVDSNLKFSTVTLDVRSIIECKLSISINDVELDDFELEGGFTTRTLKIPPRTLGTKTLSIRLSVDPDITFPRVEMRPLKFAVKSLTLSL